MALVDPCDRILRVNPAFMRLFGYREDEAVGRTIAELIVPEGSEAEAFSITQRIARGELVQQDVVRQHKEGAQVAVCVVGAPIRLQGSEIAAYGIYQDIRARKALEEELHRRSTTDTLTGLLNRRGFTETSERAWALGRRRGEDLLVLYADLDGFKQTNDEYGHAAGDRMLQDVAEILRQSFRSTDVIARMGGDEFVILAMDAGNDAEVDLIRRFREAVRRYNESREHPYPLRLSIGTHRALAREVNSLEELLTEADRRMYEQKQERGTARPESMDS